MREKKTFAERKLPSRNREARRKYFLVYEGKNTEAIYFDAVIAHREEIGINPLIELVPVIRSYSEEDWSNPKKILDRVELNLLEAEEGFVSYETLLNRFMEYLCDEGIIRNNRTASRTVWNILLSLLRNELYVRLEEKVEDVEAVCSQIFDYLSLHSEWKGIVDNVETLLDEHRGIMYEKGFDRICFIFDRDRDSFLSCDGNNQYEYVLGKCRDCGYGFYISNPCFEFWLLMHFDEVRNLDFDMIRENTRVSSRRSYTENELRKLLPGYTKSKYRADTLMCMIDRAVANEKLFCENEDELEHSIGSRVGLLFEELMV